MIFVLPTSATSRRSLLWTIQSILRRGVDIHEERYLLFSVESTPAKRSRNVGFVWYRCRVACSLDAV